MEHTLVNFTQEENKRIKKASELIGDLPVVFNIKIGIDFAKLHGYREDKYVKIINNVH